MRISGITIPDSKRIEIGLTAVYGVGRSLASKILKEASVDPGKKGKEISVAEENKIREAMGSIKVEGDLKREKSGNIKRLKDIESFRGSRHAKSLPSRGQRTKSNSRTVRGNVRKTMASGRVKTEKK